MADGVRRQSWPGSSLRAPAFARCANGGGLRRGSPKREARRRQLGGPRIRPLRRPDPRLALQRRPWSVRRMPSAVSREGGPMQEPPRTPDPSQGDIDALLNEDRVFDPPPLFRQQANASDAFIYEQADLDPESVLGRVRRRTRVDPSVGHGARVERASREVVRRRHAQRLGELRRPARPDGPPKQGRDRLGRGAGRFAHTHLLGAAPRGEPVRERAQAPRCPPRRPCGRLHADGARAPGRSAGVRAHRRGAQRRVRRLQRRVACATGSTTRRPPCWSPPMAATAAAA